MRLASSTSCAAVREGNLADVLQEELERVGGDLPGLGLEIELGRVLRVVDDFDVQLLERRVELAELHRLELVAQGQRDFLVRQEARQLSLAHERPGVLMVEHEAHFTPLSHLDVPYPLLLNVVGSRCLSTAARSQLRAASVATLARRSDVRHAPFGGTSRSGPSGAWGALVDVFETSSRRSASGRRSRLDRRLGPGEADVTASSTCPSQESARPRW